MIGYLESWNLSKLSFTEAAEKGYTAIVLGFGTINGTLVDIFRNPSTSFPSIDDLKHDIQSAKENGAQHILFSVGGANNTYFPDYNRIDELATNIVVFLNEYGFTGIDFDLEINTDGEKLDELCERIQEIDANLILTAAPQMNQEAHETDLFLVSKGMLRIYDIAIANKRFQYLFVQAYNNQWPVINGSNQSDVMFISDAYGNLKKCIPASTLIAIGEPANSSAATYGVFQGPNNGEEIYQKMANEYEIISMDKQYGGIMVWNINLDAESDYQFVNAMKDVSVPITLV